MESIEETIDMPADESTEVSDVIEIRHTATVGREERKTVGEVRVDEPRIRCNDVNVFYGDGNHAIKDINLDIAKNEILAMIGPSGCGKSTFLRCLNRMNDTVPGCKVTGEIIMDGRTSTARTSM